MADYSGEPLPAPAFNSGVKDFKAGEPTVKPPQIDASVTRNRVWDTIAGGLVSWETSGADPDGLAYPGPGSFPTDVRDYVIEEEG